MKILKELGQPMLYAGIGLFAAAAKADQLWLYWAAAAVFVTGAILFVAGPFLPGGKTGGGLFSGGGAGVWRSSGSPRRAPTCSGYPVTVKNAVPEWVYVVSFVVSVSGVIAFALGPNGISPRTITTLAMVPGGVFFYLAARMYYGGAVARRNVSRGSVAVIGFILLIAGVHTYVLAFAGAFDGPERPFWFAGGSLAVLAGLAAVWYGLKYQQSEEGVAIGRELGLAAADSGLFAPDGVYDSKGVLDGVELKFNVEQQPPVSHKGSYTPAKFRLEVLCFCSNARGLCLEVRPESFLSFSLSGLPKSPHIDYWDGYEIRANMQDVAAGPLVAAKAGENVFNGHAGFAGLVLEGNGLKLTFAMEGYANTPYVKRVLEDAARLAKAFN